MKRIIIFFLLGLFLLVAVLLFRTFTFNPQSYPALSTKVTTNAHPEVLAKALTYQTISHKPGMIDSEAFRGLHQHLLESFPLTESVLRLELVGDFSMVFHWPGADPNLEPVILMAHMDVVPVEYSSMDQWEQAPFGGIRSEGYLYGRGALDDKGSLVAILDAVENLLANDFNPSRDLYLCFGHDEEIGGANGAELISDHLLAQGIKAWMVLDEGGTLATGLIPGINDTVALIGTSEKGYVSLELSANIPGGHSSMPEKSNALAAVNRALHKLSENPLPYRFSPPLEGFIQHVGPHLSGVKKLAFANTWLLQGLIFDAYQKSAAGEALIHTTQVATIFNAGVKDNVVPYRAQAVVNYRLLPGDTPEFILERAEEIAADTQVNIRIYNDLAIPASPVSATNCDQFRQIAGAVKAVSSSAIISPYLVLGATDGRHFYALSDHVYRFSPIPIDQQDLSRIHGVNERVSVRAYQKAVDFYATLINSL